MTKSGYTDEEYRQVRENLAAIMSVKEDESSMLLHDGHMHEVSQMSDLFKRMSGILAHKWMAPVLAKIPEQAWGGSEAGERHVIPDDFASMRFLSPEITVKYQKTAAKLVAARKVLMEGLCERDGPYREMTAWTEPEGFTIRNMRHLPLIADIAFSETLVRLEDVLNHEMHICDARWRQAMRWPQNRATPSAVTRESSRQALEFLKKQIDYWCRTDGPDGKLPDSLRARVAANLSANRAILELCAKDARGKEAAQVTIPFFGKLNECGIVEVDEEVLACDDGREKWTGLPELLARWFGHKGLLRERDVYFARVMTPSQIETAVRWSEHIQKKYLADRGSAWGPKKAAEAHGNAHNLFIFAMATVSTFYVKGNWGGKAAFRPVQTLNEFPNRSSSRYSSFPASGAAKGDKLLLPRIHTEELIKQVYGQIYYANTGFDVLADGVRDYAESRSSLRAHLQQLHEFAVRNRSAQELLNLHKHLAAYVNDKYRTGEMVEA